MRVALVYHFFAHYRSGVLDALLEDSDHEYVACGDPDPTFYKSIKRWQPTNSKKWLTARCRRIGPVMWQHGLLRLALRRDVDCIIYLANLAWPATWLSAALARLTGKRVLFWTHGWIKDEAGIRRIIRDRFYRLAHGLLLYGNIAKCIGLRHGFPPERLHVIYNSLDYNAQRQARAGVSPQDIEFTRRSLFTDPSRPMVVCPTRLTAVRRLDMLLYAAALLREQHRPVNVLLVGDGPERQSLTDLAGKLGVDVCLYGSCYEEATLAKLIMASDVTVAPGKVGLTAMHSLAYGTPVVTHNDADQQMPEWESIIDGVTGSFFTIGDVHGLASAIDYWTNDGCKSEQTTAACHRIIERFYNPVFQRMAIDRAVEGRPADDLFWMKEATPCQE